MNTEVPILLHERLLGAGDRPVQNKDFSGVSRSVGN